MTALPPVTAVATKGQICRFVVSTITGAGAASYSWNTGAITPAISFTLSLTTTYTLTGTDLNGCAKTVTVTQFVATCIGMADLPVADNPGINIYPNPNSGTFNISSDVNFNLSVVNSLGQVVRTMTQSEANPHGYRGERTVHNLPNGVYFIIGENDRVRINKKIIVEK